MPTQLMKCQVLFISVSQSWYQVVCVLLRVRYRATRTQSRGGFKTGERKQGSFDRLSRKTLLFHKPMQDKCFRNMKRFSKCRATQIEAIKVVKHPGHRQAIKRIRTPLRYVRPAGKETRQNACELPIGQQASKTFSSTNH